MAAEDVASADVTACGGEGKQSTTAMDKATGQPWLCLRGHVGTGDDC